LFWVKGVDEAFEEHQGRDAKNVEEISAKRETGRETPDAANTAQAAGSRFVNRQAMRF
jgi:hypothetical protein